MQVRHWFADALLTAVLRRHSSPTVDVALAFPDVDRYQDLINRTESALRALKIGVYLVPKVGPVEQRIPPATS